MEMDQEMELLNVCGEQHLQLNESNISVEDLNQSINMFLNSFNGNSVGESLDCNRHLIDMSMLSESWFVKNQQAWRALINRTDKALLDEKEKLFQVELALESKGREYDFLFAQNEELKNTIAQKDRALLDEKQKAFVAIEEIQKIQSVAEKRFIKLNETVLVLKQSLSEEQQKSLRLENELKNVNHIHSQQTKENIEMGRKIQSLESDVKTLKKSLEESTNVKGSTYYCLPTNVNINGCPPNFPNPNMSSMDISNCSNDMSLSINQTLPIGTGSRFTMADEEEQFIDPNQLDALKRGEISIDGPLNAVQRMSILKRRNKMVLPHLRSSYAVELPFMRDDVSPEELKGFSSNDSFALNQSSKRFKYSFYSQN